MNGAVLIAIAVEEDFKNYLIVCEYMQIDPSTYYEQDFIERRANEVLSAWQNCEDEKQFRQLEKKLKWIVKKYKSLTKSGFFSLAFVNKCKKHIAKGKLRISEGTVSDVYVKNELTQKNYETYKNPKKCN